MGNQMSRQTLAIKSFFRSNNFGLICVFIAMSVIFMILSPHYLSPQNIMNILVSASLVGLVAIGESYLIIGGQIDLSPGSVAAFAGVVAAWLSVNGVHILFIIPIVLGLGTLIGMFNAFQVNKIKIQPFIATLASMSIFRGFAYIICNGKPIYVGDEAFMKLGNERILGVPVPVLILIAAFIVFGVLLAKTCFGRNIYATGGNASAARLAGIRPNAVKTKLYIISGALAALGGVILTARMNTGQPTAANGLEFDAITATVLGGTAMTGGLGSMSGTFLGVLILQGFNNGLLLLNVPSFWQYVARGLLLVLALTFDYYREKKRNAN